MELRVTVHRGRLGPTEYRVLRPAGPVPCALLVDRSWYLDAAVDGDAARVLAGLWLLAARSPRSLIHLPIRTNRAPAGFAAAGTAAAGTEPRLDLVLLHHSLGFAPATWKRLRARLGPGRPHTASLPEAERPDPPVDYRARRHRENRDLFHQHVHAGTLFLVGSAAVFRATAPLFLDLARNGADYARTHPARPHYCVELHRFDGVLARAARDVHVEYRDRDRWDAVH